MSKAIILVAFGSTNLQGIENSIGLLEENLNEVFGSEYTIFKSFTSNKIINILKERYDYLVPYLNKILFNLVNQGYDEAIIQPLHIMSTVEIKKIEEIVDEYRYSMKKILICKTLFSNDEQSLLKESHEIADIICADLDESNILLVGHGSKRNSNKLYDVIAETVRERCNKKVYLATLEGEKNFNLAIDEIVKDNVKKIFIKSLFIIPGKHVVDDILSGDNSLVKKIENLGVEVKMKESSLLQYYKIRKLYVENIKNNIN